MALPLLGLWLLLARPHLDGLWQNQVAHFWLVVSIALVNVGLGSRISQQARLYGDARLFLVSLAFLASAGFLFLHALATPTVLVSGRSTGFVIATPVGLLLASGFAAWSSIELGSHASATIMRRQGWLRYGLGIVMVAWAFASLYEIPPVGRPLELREGLLAPLAMAGVLLYAVAAFRYFRLHRRRPSVVLLGLITAFVLLAEALATVALARDWHVSWWEWHVLMAVAFGYVAYSARVHYRREGSETGLFGGISLEQTIRNLREEYGSALEALVEAIQRRQETGVAEPVGAIAGRLGERFGLTEGQAQVLGRAAEALAAEREQVRRLDALVAVAHETRLMLAEDRLLERAVGLTGSAFGPEGLRVGLLEEGELRFPAALQHGTWDGGGEPEREATASALASLEPAEGRTGAGTILVMPLTVKGTPAGVLEVRQSGDVFSEADKALLESLAGQLSVAVENARLYRHLDGLFRQYMSPAVATALLADGTRAELGGAIVETTVLFADLRGFTSFSEESSPREVVELLNRYFGIAVPIVLEQGGTVDKFVGDALMALFNVPVLQPDHALRAARAALGIQQAIEALAADRPDWPRFRVGINTGPALVGNIGSAELRNFTAIGDVTNVAARLEATAEPGQVVIGSTTFALVRHTAEVRPLGRLDLKGKEEAVEAFLLLGLGEGAIDLRDSDSLVEETPRPPEEAAARRSKRSKEEGGG